MKAWSYYALHTFINSLKKIFRTKFLVFIIICILCGIIFGFGLGVVFDALDESGYDCLEISEITSGQEYLLLDEDGNPYHGEDIFINAFDSELYVNSDNKAYDIVEINDYLDSDKDHVLSREEIAEFIYTSSELNPENYAVSSFELSEEEESGLESFLGFELTDDNLYIFVEAIVEIVFIIFILFSIYFGAKKGCDIFLMPDVNFLFAAPMKGQSVLLFRLSFQLVGTLFGSLYLLFQIPNLLNAGLSILSILFGIGGFLMMLFMQKVINVLSYILCAENAWLKQNLQRIVLGIGAAIILVTFLVYKQTGDDILATADLLFGPNATRYIPIFGWFKAMVTCGMSGDYSLCAIYFVLFTLAIIGIGILTWSIKSDFYEEALLGAQTRDQVQQAAQEKNQASLVREKERSKRIKRNTGMKGFGANMFFHKELYNRKRMAFFGIITNTMLTYLGFTIVPLIIMLFFVKSTQFNLIVIILAIVLFFRSMGNPIATEVENAWIFLAPYDMNVKILYSMLAGSLSCFLDLLPSMVIACIFTKANPFTAILWYLTLLLLDFAISAFGIMLDALIPSEGLDNIKVAITMMIRFTMAGIFFAIVGICGAFIGIIPGLLISDVFLVSLSLIGFFVYPLKADVGF